MVQKTEVSQGKALFDLISTLPKLNSKLGLSLTFGRAVSYLKGIPKLLPLALQGIIIKYMFSCIITLLEHPFWFLGKNYSQMSNKVDKKHFFETFEFACDDLVHITSLKNIMISPFTESARSNSGRSSSSSSSSDTYNTANKVALMG